MVALDPKLDGRFDRVEVYSDDEHVQAPRALQVKLDANSRTRAYWAFWRDQHDQKRGRRLGPARP